MDKVMRTSVDTEERREKGMANSPFVLTSDAAPLR